jgi:hypothetical protein
MKAMNYLSTAATKGREANIDRLKQEADTYLDDSVDMEDVTESTIYLRQYDEQQQRFLGFTAVETASGVSINRYSDGSYKFSVVYEDEVPDTTVETVLHAGGKVEVKELSLTLPDELVSLEIQRLTRLIHESY